jgi:leucyl aminopeptidase
MKADMSGGGTVIAAMRALRELDAPISVIGVVPLTENMPGGSALKPGDILTALDGRSVEIINTDAEGRLVMADGLTHAAREGATHLVDVASLTGYVRMALGHTATGAMTNSQALLGLVMSAAEAGGERIWEMPMYPEFDVCLDTEVADVKNLGSSDAGGISHAAVFLREFVGQVPWVHLDICGSFVNDEPSLRDILPEGPTGAMVDTLSHLPFLMDGFRS